VSGAADPVALIPAAGLAKRLGRPAASKEILPVRFDPDDVEARPVCEYLLDSLSAAGVRRAFVILRMGKWDIPEVLGNGDRFGLRLAYLVTDATPGTPYTLDQASPLIGNGVVLLGFPDILYHPRDAFGALLRRTRDGRAEVVLGLFPAEDPCRMDMVDIDADGRVRDIVIKPETTTLTLTWVLAVWSPEFTRFMHDYLGSVLAAVTDGRYPDPDSPHEPYMGDVIRAAMAKGMRVEGVVFQGGNCVDIGTPEDLDRVTP